MRLWWRCADVTSPGLHAGAPSRRQGGAHRGGCPGLTISFSGQIPLFSGNGIPFRNFGKFRRILLNFEFENEKYRKIPKFRIPVTSGNRKKPEISAKFRRKVKPCSAAAAGHCLSVSPPQWVQTCQPMRFCSSFFVGPRIGDFYTYTITKIRLRHTYY